MPRPVDSSAAVPVRHYTHLSAEDRAFVMMQLDQGASYASIARRLGRARSTIAREVARNVCQLEATDLPAEPASAASVHRYQASAAGHAYRIRRQQSVRQRRLIEGQPLYWRVYDDLVNRRWSPQQIAARLRLMNPDDPTQHVSHETIYASIYAFPRGALKKGMVEALRQSKPQRGLRRRSLSKGHTVPEALHIVNRPEEIEHRLVPGHWEGDFIKGAFNRSAVGTLVERKTRFVVLCRMSGCTAEDALEGFSRQMKKLPAFMRESMTYDRGSEMACHARLAERLKLDIWFADPYAPWQRGSNENTNGLVRQFLPKGTDLSTVDQGQLNQIAYLMNGRPRKTLGWRTPAEAVQAEIELFKKNVALDS